MRFRGWAKEPVVLAEGMSVSASCPVVVSASRSTDIPAFFPKWFSNSLQRGYIRRVNPFNRKPEYISFSATRAIVFWSKNPRPLIPFLPELEEHGINYYFQFTLNNYEKEGLEPGVPPLAQRIETFCRLSKRLGRKRVIWRFDPLILTDSLTIDHLLERVAGVAEQIKTFTERLVISFADIAIYAKVRNNLARANIHCHEFTPDRMLELAQRLQVLNREWGLKIATCAEALDLEPYGIEHNRCIDDRLMIDLFSHDRLLMEFLGHERSLAGLNGGMLKPRMKDKGQRQECGCIVSKDIGMYDTCSHLCAYCYANTSRKAVESNLQRHRSGSDAIVS